MQAIKSQNTKPEIIVRKLIYALGYRYRLHKKGMPGKPDIIFNGRRKIIFVHGCFWHQHDSANCKIARIPKSNQEFWIPKLEKTKLRDLNQIEILISQGWKVLLIWECEVKNTEMLTKKIEDFLGGLT